MPMKGLLISRKKFGGNIQIKTVPFMGGYGYGKKGVFGYIRGVSIMMKGVSPMNGENSVGVPFDS